MQDGNCRAPMLCWQLRPLSPIAAYETLSFFSHAMTSAIPDPFAPAKPRFETVCKECGQGYHDIMARLLPIVVLRVYYDAKAAVLTEPQLIHK